MDMRGSDSMIIDNEKMLEKMYGVTNSISFEEEPRQRLRQFVSEIGKPSLFTFDGYEVELVWPDTVRTIQESVKNIFVRE